VNLLFVCSRNRLRSPTAETVFTGRPGLEVMSAGTAPDADLRVSGDLIEWADIVFAMETVHRKRLSRDFSVLMNGERVVVLGIPDRYQYMEQLLVELLEQRVAPYLG
jgi:predicted protein tyrosine phosphatase